MNCSGGRASLGKDWVTLCVTIIFILTFIIIIIIIIIIVVVVVVVVIVIIYLFIIISISFSITITITITNIIIITIIYYTQRNCSEMQSGYLIQDMEDKSNACKDRLVLLIFLL